MTSHPQHSDRYPGLTDELLAVLRTTDVLPGEHAVYERVVKWVNVDGTASVAQSNTPSATAMTGERSS